MNGITQKLYKVIKNPKLIPVYLAFKIRFVASAVWKRLPEGLKTRIKNDYKLHYRVAAAQYVLQYRWRQKRSDVNLALILAESSRGWILDGICREIAIHYPRKTVTYYALSDLPVADNYFFSHYSLLPTALKLNPHIWKKGIYVYYTHPRPLAWSDEELVYAFNRCTKVVCMCSLFERYLRDKGVKAECLTHIVGGADGAMFQPHSRDGGAVGLSSAYYERKAPDRILELIKLRPDLNFILLGRNWDNYPRYEELIAQVNLEYVETDYQNYPDYYRKMDVFVSPAILEGGPIPLLEAMMSNVVPVASNTGFAPDVILDGYNGYLFPVDASAELISDLIDKAYKIQTDIRQTVEHLSWETFTNNIERLITSS